VALVLSVALLAYAVRSLPIGTAYAVWTGIGGAGTALFGVWLFEEPATAGRLPVIMPASSMSCSWLGRTRAANVRDGTDYRRCASTNVANPSTNARMRS
jgi:hypothetical protein